MVNLFKFIVAALLFSFGSTAFAQCMGQNDPGPPRLWDSVRACYVPQGTPQLQQGYSQQQQFQQQCVTATVNGRTACYAPQYLQQLQQQQQYQQFQQQQGYMSSQGIPIPQGIAAGQMFTTMVNGQRMRCSWSDRAASGLAGAAIANVAAYAINRLAGRNHDVVDRRGATAAGGLVGATVMCDPESVNDNVMPQRQGVVVTPQQPPYYQQQPQPSFGNQHGGTTVSEPSVCVIEGVNPIRGISQDDCFKLRGRMTLSATATATASVSTAAVTQVAAASNFCVRAGQKYDCGDKAVVIRPGGAIQCLPSQRAQEPGDQLCTGIQ